MKNTFRRFRIRGKNSGSGGYVSYGIAKRMWALALVIIMLFALLPTGFLGSTARAATQVIYEPKELKGKAIFNIDQAEKLNFMKTQLSTGKQSYNVITDFFMEGNDWVKLYPSSELKRAVAEFVLELNTSKYQTVNELRQQGQIKGVFKATLVNDAHTSFYHHWTTSVQSAPYIHIASRSKYLDFIGNTQTREEGPFTYDPSLDESFSLNSDTGDDFIKLSLNHTGCREAEDDHPCGDAWIKNPGMGFVDSKYPYVKYMYTSTDIDGNTPDFYFKAGEKVYLQLEFSEYIRFSNNVAPSDVTVDLKLAVDGNEVTGHNQKATMVQLKDKRLTFEYTVPNNLMGNVPTNHYLLGIAQPTHLVGAVNGTDFTLALYKPVSGEDPAGGNTGLGFTKTGSLITDLAGNPWNWAASVKSINGYDKVNTMSRTKLDNVAPTVEKLTLNSQKPSTLTAEQINDTTTARSVCVGETLTLTAYMSEPVYFPGSVGRISDVKATLNINKNGSPVVLEAADIKEVNVGVNVYENVTMITFDPLVITDDMTTESSSIAITSVSWPADSADSAGNLYGGATPPAITEQRMLDTLPATVGVYGQTADPSGKYAPVWYSDGQGDPYNGFYLPVQITDTQSTGSNNMSGTLGAWAWFRLENSASVPDVQTYEYALTATGAKPTATAWKQATTADDDWIAFKILDKTDYVGNYIHIRAISGTENNLTDVELVIKACDLAGNFTPDTSLPLNDSFKADSVGPLIDRSGVSTNINNSVTPKTADINARVNFYDASNVNGNTIQYQWTDVGVAAAEDGWLTLAALSSEKSVDAVFPITGLRFELGDTITKRLHLKVEDCSAVSKQTTTTLDYTVDINLPGVDLAPTSDVAEEPTVMIKFPSAATTVNNENNDPETVATAIILIEDPKAEGNYFMRQINSVDHPELIDTGVNMYGALAQYDDYNYPSWSTLRTSTEPGIKNMYDELFEWLYVKGIDENVDYTYYTTDLTLRSDTPQTHGSGTDTALYKFNIAAVNPSDTATGLATWTFKDEIFSQNGSIHTGACTIMRLCYMASGHYTGNVNVKIFYGAGYVGDLGGWSTYIDENGYAPGTQDKGCTTAEYDSDVTTGGAKGNVVLVDRLGHSNGNFFSEAQIAMISRSSNNSSVARLTREEWLNDVRNYSTPTYNIIHHKYFDYAGLREYAPNIPVYSSEWDAVLLHNTWSRWIYDPGDTELSKHKMYNGFITHIPSGAQIGVEEFTLKADSETPAFGGAGVSMANKMEYAAMSIYEFFKDNTFVPPEVDEFALTTTYMTPSGETELASDYGRRAFSEYTGDLIDGKTRYPTSIAHCGVKLDITNELTASLYGVSNIDFEDETKTKIELLLCDASGTPTGSPVWTGKLQALTSQVVSIPETADNALGSGYYTFKVSLYNKVHDKVQSWTYPPFYVDKSSAGRAYPYYTANTAAASLALTSPELITMINNADLGANNVQQAYIGAASGQTGKLHMYVENAERGAGSTAASYTQLRMWNVTGMPTEMAKYAYGSSTWSSGTVNMGPEPGATASDDRVVIEFTAVPKANAAALQSGTAEANTVWLVPGENIIRYQTRNANGVLGSVGTMVIWYMDEATTVTPIWDDPGTKVQSVTVAVGALSGTAAPTDIRIFREDGLAHTYGGYDAAADYKDVYNNSLPVNMQETVTANGTYTYYVLNKWGNITKYTADVTKPVIDGAAPVVAIPLTGVSYTSGSREFVGTITVTDNNVDTTKLYMKVTSGTSGYAAFVGECEIAALHDTQATTLSTGGAMGIYKTTPGTPTADSRTVTVEGALPYWAAGGGSLSDVKLVFYAVDEAGNVSAEQEIDMSGLTNAEPAPTVTLENGRIKLDFNALVVMGSQYADPDNMGFTHGKYVPIYADGPYEIEYMDTFGQTYKKNIDVTAWGEYAVAVSYSTKDPTKDNVTVIVSAENNQYITLEPVLPVGNVESYTLSDDGKIATFVFSTNGDNQIKLKHTDGNDMTITVNVTNIDKTAPAGELMYYFTQWGASYTKAELQAALSAKTFPGMKSDGTAETNRPVKVYIRSDEPIVGINGTNTETMFKYADGATAASYTYTFEYQDAAGNLGAPSPVTATLMGVALVWDPTSDTVKPEVSASIEALISNTYTSVNSYAYDYQNLTIGDMSMAYTDINANAMCAKLSLSIRDDNPTCVGVRASGEAAITTYNEARLTPSTVTGVSVVGDALLIEADSTFIVYVVDAQNNVTSFAVTISNIDSLAPTATVTRVWIGNYMVREYFDFHDDKTSPANIVITSPSDNWVTEANGVHAGKRYREFKHNGDTVVTFKDEVGRYGSYTVSITGLDDRTPALDNIKWIPSADALGANPPLDTETLDQTVIAQLTFNRDVTNVEFRRWDGSAEVIANIEDFIDTHVTGGKNMSIEFKQQADIRMYFEALNGLTGSCRVNMPATVDMTAPTVAATRLTATGGAKNMVEYKFVFNKDIIPERREVNADGVTVYDPLTTNGVVVIPAGTEIVRTFTENGTFDLSFRDVAGNRCTATVTINDIDPDPPMLDAKNMQPVGNTVKFEASMSEAGTLRLYSIDDDVIPIESHSVSAPNGTTMDAWDYVTFTVSANGAYWLDGEDAAGWHTRYNVAITGVDVIPPTLTFAPVIVTVKNDAVLADVIAAMEAGITKSDNRSAQAGIKYTCDTTIDQTMVNTVGLHGVDFTVTDAAGNSRKQTRILRVMDANVLSVTANGIITAESAVTVLVHTGSTTTINFTVENPQAVAPGEPYRIYILAGRNSVGQMKRGTLVHNNTITGMSDGLYTVYIVTQSRKTYLTYVYVQEQ